MKAQPALHLATGLLSLAFLSHCNAPKEQSSHKHSTPQAAEQHRSTPSSPTQPDTQQSRYQAGDILLIQTGGTLMEAVHEATGSPWTHVGVMLPNPHQDNQLMVAEAVGPVRWSTLAQFTSRSSSKQVRVLRPDPALSNTQIDQLVAAAEQLMGRPYDPQFVWDDSKIYCSEFVWKIYHNGLELELTERPPFSAFQLNGPIAQQIIPYLHPNGVPLDEPTVPPHILANSTHLTEITP